MMVSGKHFAKAAKQQRNTALACFLIAIAYVVALVVLTPGHGTKGGEPRSPIVSIDPG